MLAALASSAVFCSRYWDTDIPLAAAINSVYWRARAEPSAPAARQTPANRSALHQTQPSTPAKTVLQDRPPFRRGLLVDERENVRLGRLGQFNDERTASMSSVSFANRHELVDLLVNRISLSGEIC